MVYKSQNVAVKIYSCDSHFQNSMDSFKRELRSLLACNHKNIIKCYGGGISGKKVFIVLEKCNSDFLLSYLMKDRKKWANPEEIPSRWLFALAQLAAGLHHMSQVGVRHRDIQEHNVLVKEIEPAL